MNKKIYICPQCGVDENGAEVHQLVYHVWPFMTVEQAKANVAKKAAAKKDKKK